MTKQQILDCLKADTKFQAEVKYATVKLKEVLDKPASEWTDIDRIKFESWSEEMKKLNKRALAGEF